MPIPCTRERRAAAAVAGHTAVVKEEYKTEGPLTLHGLPWWRPQITPGMKQRKLGGEKRIAAYLNFNVAVGEEFTMRQLREELGREDVAEGAEQLNRRLRNLRPDGWRIASYKDDRSLAAHTYRLDHIGTRVWLGERNKRDVISAKARRLVFERDNLTCAVCGIAKGDEYHEFPSRTARMTVGHRVPGERLGGASVDELQAECAMCNEPLRDEIPDPETYAEVLPEVRSLKTAELRELRAWLQSGRRSRSKVERVYGRIRRLSQTDREEMARKVSAMLADGR